MTPAELTRLQAACTTPDTLAARQGGCYSLAVTHRVHFELEHRFNGLLLSYRIVRLNPTRGEEVVSGAPAGVAPFENLGELRESLESAGLGNLLQGTTIFAGALDITPRQLELLGFVRGANSQA